jgi:alanine or glycine:cation symporter, AGCS family
VTLRLRPALLEPFIDTIVICTMTALIIVITGAYLDPAAAELGGVALTSDAFETVIPGSPTSSRWRSSSSPSR